VSRLLRAQIRARSRAQLICLAALVIDAVAGMACIATGREGLGAALTGLALISTVPYSLWMRTTQLPPSG
jgi:hypothetical protein